MSSETQDEPLFEILPGLPPYGPAAEPFPEDGGQAYREGLVVEFRPRGRPSWVANFQKGASGVDAVVRHPDQDHVIVVAGGTGFIVDPVSRRQTHQFLLSGAISFLQSLPELNLVVVGDGLRIAACLADDTGWCTERISWDGMRNITVSGSTLRGEAWSPVSDRWYPFVVDLLTGKMSGAIYPQEMANAIRIGPSV
jgi:hypothetical protein